MVVSRDTEAGDNAPAWERDLGGATGRAAYFYKAGHRSGIAIAPIVLALQVAPRASRVASSAAHPARRVERAEPLCLAPHIEPIGSERHQGRSVKDGFRREPAWRF